MKLYIVDYQKRGKNKLYTQSSCFTSLNKFTNLVVTTLFIATSLIVSNAIGQEFIVLTADSPNTLIEAGKDAVIYGTAEPNDITIKKGALVKILNNPGNNTIKIETDSTEFKVLRSGAMVTFESEDVSNPSNPIKTTIKLPATKTTQTIKFNNGSLELFIDSGSVMLGKQEITKTLTSISEINNNSILYIGIMVHLEGYNLDDDTVYNNYKNDINTLVSIFNEYSAKLTLELKEPITACVERNDFYFKAFEDAGHGIGVHADVGGTPDSDDTWQDSAFLMTKMKQELEKQGVSVRHTSGYCSPLDWVSAVIEAGYSFVTGGVSWCLMCLPEENIPEEYASCKNPAECHDNYPPQLIDRLHPWIIKRGHNWTEHHSDGELVYFPAAIEGLPYLSEKKIDPNFNGNPSFDDEDIEVYIEQLEEALSMVDDSQPNFAYVSWSYGKKMPDDFARKWLSAIKPYIDSGKVQWKTIPEMYDIYIESL